MPKKDSSLGSRLKPPVLFSNTISWRPTENETSFFTKILAFDNLSLAEFNNSSSFSDNDSGAYFSLLNNLLKEEGIDATVYDPYVDENTINKYGGKKVNSINDALKIGNNLQDILTNEFVTGRTGNEILKLALSKARSSGIKPQIYTHPIGYYGHGSGPTIGMWDKQNGVPVNGDYPLYPNTAFSIELNAKVFIKSWNKEIAIMLEEDAFFNGIETTYIDPRQTELILIK